MATTNDSSYRCFSPASCRAATLSPTYHRHLFDFEENFKVCDNFEYLMNKWWICLIVIAVYLVTVYVGQHLMRSRPPYQLRGALVWWNVSMAVFSGFCAWRTMSAVLYQWSLDGFYQTVCGTAFSKQHHHALAIYILLLSISKVVELGDTAFIVLRKTPLIILHWFHHATVLFFACSGGGYPSAIHNYFMAINFSVHAIMYPYYLLKILKIRVPKLVSMAITSLQLIQMLLGLFITLYTYYMRAMPGVGCCVVDRANQIALAIYFSYFVLFSNFFIRSYLLKKRSLACVKKSD